MGFYTLLCFAIIFLSFDYATCQVRYCNEGLGECVPFARCSNLTQFFDGTDKINVRFSIEPETEACHYLETCCDPEDVIAELAFEENRIETTEETTFLPISKQGFKGAINVEPTTEDFKQATDFIPPEILPGSDNDVQEPVRIENLPSTTENSCNEATHECIPFFYCASEGSDTGIFKVQVDGVDTNPCKTASQVCCNKTHNIGRKLPKTCGVHNKDGIGFSVYKVLDEALYGEFPWMAALSYLNYDGKYDYICGGSLIDPHVVLTGAHCVHDREVNDLKVRLGEWDTQTTREIFPHTDHEVAQVIIHPNFGTGNLFNDVALLVLKTPAKLSSFINTICLPPQNYKFDKTTCLASGWGQDKFGHEGLYRVNLKRVELPVVPLKECQDSLRTTRLGPKFRLDTSFFCAGGERDVDTCTGDGGSPLVCPVPGQNEIYYQAGAVAWGIECGQEGIPGVYASIAKFRNWIDGQMNELGYGTASYTLV